MTCRFALVLLLPLAACGGVDIEELRDQQRRWRAESIDDYAFIWHMGCFCAFMDVEGARTEVRAGVPITTVGVGTGLPFDRDARTIDDIFDEAIETARADPDEYSVRYDDAHHFITRLETDPDTGAEDDGFTLEVRCFSTDADAGCPVTELTESECDEAGGTPSPVDVSDPLLACGASYPGAVGRISGSTDVCCTSELP